MATDKKVLLPCPFCGHKEPYRHTLVCGGCDSQEEGVIRCGGCGAQGPSGTSSWEEIIDGWNRRVKKESRGKVSKKISPKHRDI